MVIESVCTSLLVKIKVKFTNYTLSIDMVYKLIKNKLFLKLIKYLSAAIFHKSIY